MRAGTPTLVLLGLIATTGCGGSSSAPTSPSTPPPPPANDAVAINVYNSSTGLVRTVYRTAQPGESIKLSVGELSAPGVDPMRVALREAHAGDRLGSLVAFSASGFVTFNVSSSRQYDLFLMSAANAVNYDCLDYLGERGSGGVSTRYATLRRASAGETLLPGLFTSYPVLDGPDEHFKWAADLFTKTLSPFGIAFGSVTFVSAASADIVSGWADIPGMGLASSGAFAVWEGYRTYPMIPTPAHELAHAWLGASDYFKNTACFEGNGLSGLLFSGGASQGLSRRGEDALRYWALKADSWR